jgi:hypothetical protein
MTKTSFQHTFSLGKVSWEREKHRRINEVTIKAELTLKETTQLNWDTLEPVTDGKDWIFSASGNVWNAHHTDIITGGQIIDTLYERFKSGIELMYSMWEKYHLNDLKAGTKAQTEALDAWETEKRKRSETSDGSHTFPQAFNSISYEDRCEYLKSIGLYYDRGYKYGSKWLFMPIPTDDVYAIQTMLETGSMRLKKAEIQG